MHSFPISQRIIGWINSRSSLKPRWFATDINKIQVLSTWFDKKVVNIEWNDGRVSKFHHKWLRDHCACKQCFNPVTLQRQIDTYAIPMHLEPVSIESNDNLIIHWDKSMQDYPCQRSSFPLQWLREHDYSYFNKQKFPVHYYHHRMRVPWNGNLKENIPELSYEDMMKDDTLFLKGLAGLQKYGILLVENTPLDLKSTEEFSQKIGFIKKTMYGEMWSTQSQEQETYNDTAYTNLELFHHTDCTYLRDPPGLQIFNCTHQATKGGTSRFVDGLHVAEILRDLHPKAFQFFCRIKVPYHCYDKGVHLQTMESIIVVDDFNQIVQFRHNDYDRSILSNLAFEEVEQFYEYHQILTEIIRKPEMELQLNLKLGQMILIDNQRVLHGRYAFEGSRSLIGCYIGRDEYESRLRVNHIL